VAAAFGYRRLSSALLWLAVIVRRPNQSAGGGLGEKIIGIIIGINRRLTSIFLQSIWLAGWPRPRPRPNIAWLAALFIQLVASLVSGGIVANVGNQCWRGLATVLPSHRYLHLKCLTLRRNVENLYRRPGVAVISGQC